MGKTTAFEVIVIGGSYAGLSAAMALGRSLRKVLVLDSGKPCNVATPHSHNFLTQDGKTPEEISGKAQQQVNRYKTVTLKKGVAVTGERTATGFSIHTEAGKTYTAKQLIFATGVRDSMPLLKGFAACWGKTVIHCPYCHGYEVRGEKTGILGNGDMGFEFCKLISNWTPHLTLFTNGPATLTAEQQAILVAHKIAVVDKEITELKHSKGRLKHLLFIDGSKTKVDALYARVPFEQHCTIPQALGCALTEQGFLEVDVMQQTTVPGIYACGDNTTPLRSVSAAVAAGTMAGAALNKNLIEEGF